MFGKIIGENLDIDLYRLQNLKIIELTANKITTIPSSIGKMQFLERLCLGTSLKNTSQKIWHHRVCKSFGAREQKENFEKTTIKLQLFQSRLENVRI